MTGAPWHQPVWPVVALYEANVGCGQHTGEEHPPKVYPQTPNPGPQTCRPVDGRGGKGVELYNDRGVQVVDRLQRRATEPGMDAMPSAVGTLSRLLSVSMGA